MNSAAAALDVRIASGGIEIEGNLVLPERARGVVAFAHGSGSGRFSPRNRFVAETLNRAGFGTLLVDLLTTAEEEQDQFTAHLRFDIDLLSKRVIACVDWMGANEMTARLPTGLFGASTGAAAALRAEVERPVVRAVVSRGGRPDLARDALQRVRAPTLLIVGGADEPVIALNRAAMAQMTAKTELEIVPNATHLFEEPGALERVADLAAGWFARHLNA